MRTLINTEFMSDCNLVSIGDDCIVGGGAVINAHVAVGNRATVERVSIGNRVTIGQYATILPGVRIEDDVVIAANSLVPPGRTLKAGQVYSGVPVRYAGRTAPSRAETAQFQVSAIPKGDETREGGIVLSKEQLNIQQLLLESYKMRHAEVLDIVRFMSQVTIASLSVLASILLYSVINGKPQLLLFLPPLAGVALAFVLGSSVAMQRLGRKACEIEIMFQRAHVSGFDWELRYGSLGSARAFDLDALLMHALLLMTFAGGTFMTYKEYLVISTSQFLGIATQQILLAFDLFIGAWIMFSVVYLVIRHRSMNVALRRFGRGAARSG